MTFIFYIVFAVFNVILVNLLSNFAISFLYVSRFHLSLGISPQIAQDYFPLTTTQCYNFTF